VWIRDGFAVLEPFQDAVRASFDARVANLDFADPSAAETMNAWARDATNGRIDDVVEPPIDPTTVLFLMNAVFFKGTWTTQFDPGNTAPAPFHLRDGSTVEVPMMSGPVAQYTRWTPEYIAADLPYGGEAFSMTVVVPSEDVGLDAFVEGLDAEAWAALVDDLRVGGAIVFLPRFTMEFDRTLNGDLAALGMLDAFDEGRADFSRLSSTQTFLKTVKQKTFVQVNEEGTEAAAVTTAESRVTSAPPEIRADRPFLFVIRERLSGTILFMGKVVNPEGG